MSITSKKPPRPAQGGEIPIVSRKIVMEVVGEDSLQVMSYATIIENYARMTAGVQNALADLSNKPRIIVSVLPVERLEIKMAPQEQEKPA